ncbi:MAG TPA: hypothetical protein PLU43_05640 [Lachnospiraceae bacterium]|nr:hypothetical protein [Lachnospiraceae bacterium]
MAKKLGRFLAFAAVAGAAAAGVYCYLNKKDKEPCSCKDDFDDDIEKFFDDEKEKAAPDRGYVSLNKSASDPAKDAIKNAVAKAADELKEKETETADGVGLVKDSSSEAAEFAFKEFKNSDEDKKEEA